MKVGAQPNINASEYSSLNIPLPPLSKQHFIVSKLTELDDKSMETRQHINRLNSLKKGLLEKVI
jgi:type I restriction enzyme S subunit